MACHTNHHLVMLPRSRTSAPKGEFLDESSAHEIKGLYVQ
jgi:hypothetical protein